MRPGVGGKCTCGEKRGLQQLGEGRGSVSVLCFVFGEGSRLRMERGCGSVEVDTDMVGFVVMVVANEIEREIVSGSMGLYGS